MARIRTIKPEFWTDGTMIGLPFEARLFYIGMWNHACDRGHLANDPFGLKLKILPADQVDGEALLALLVSAGRVAVVSLPDGRSYLTIPRFGDHQRVDTRWNSRCPVCALADSPELIETHASFETPGQDANSETHASLRELIPGGERKGKEGNGGESADAPLSPFCPKHPNGTDKPCRACGTARLASEAAKAAAKVKPTPLPPRIGSKAPECAPGQHALLRDGTCTRCEYREAAAS